jgi:hypothetical protein
VPTASAPFWTYVERRGPEECWPWRGYVDKRYGYGFYSQQSQPIRAHRYAFEDEIGPIPEGLVLDHLCRERTCVNPGHLEPVTIAENVMRGDTYGARNAVKTHCAAGHEFTEENTYFRKDRPGRMCRQCRAIAVRKVRDKRKVA